MAIRVKKLARQLGRSPAEVLGMLQALGFERYRSAEDMLSDAVVTKVRQGWKDGILPVVVPEAQPAQRPRTTPRGQSDADLMSRLVPGVVRQPQFEAAPPRSTPGPSARPPVPAVSAPVAPPAPVRPQPVQEPDEALEADRARLAADRLALERDRAELEAAREALEAERAIAVEARSAALARELGEPLMGLLEERGLRGRDEQVRGVRALVEARKLEEILPHLAVTDPDAVRSVLDSSLVFVGGEAPPGLPPGIGAVRVAPDRGELLDADALAREVTRLGERLLLHGIRRVVLIGTPPLVQRLLGGASLDPRVELVFLSASRTLDPGRADLVIVWEGAPPAVPDELRVVQVPKPTLDALFAAVRGSLD